VQAHPDRPARLRFGVLAALLTVLLSISLLAALAAVALNVFAPPAAIFSDNFADEPSPDPDQQNSQKANDTTKNIANTATDGASNLEALRARGAYLARIGNCAYCHTARGGLPFAGGRPIDTPFGVVYSTNLTPDRERGLGAWTRADFWRALHYGVSRDGHLLNPAFPYTSTTVITRDDSDALLSYLESIPAAATLNQPSQLRWPYNSQWALYAWRALYFKPHAAASAPQPVDRQKPQERGAYLVQGVTHCLECHAPRNAMGARLDDPLQGGTLGGAQGGILGGAGGSNWYAPALGREDEASVTRWSRDDVVQFLTTGVAPVGYASGPMGEVVRHATQYLTPEDAGAIASYLQAPPWSNPSAGTPVDSAPRQPESAQFQTDPVAQALYETHCSDCHGDRGQGKSDAYPALAGNRHVTQTRTSNLIHQVLEGGFAPATAGNPRPYGMPPFMLQLSDNQIAAILTYIRQQWGNHAAPVSAFDVQQQRPLQSP